MGGSISCVVFFGIFEIPSHSDCFEHQWGQKPVPHSPSVKTKQITLADTRMDMQKQPNEQCKPYGIS